MKKFVLLFAVAAGSANAANYTPLTLPSLNTDIRTWGDGVVYDPLFPSSQTFAGVPFSLVLDSSGNDAFVGIGQITINVGVAGVTDVYTLINTAYGTAGANVGSITFNGDAGASYTVQLVEGDNVRDHYFGQYVNTTTASYVTEAVYGVNQPLNAHLDMQDFKLPAEFQAQTLTSVVFNSTGGNSGNPFLAGATALSAPATPDVNGKVGGTGLKSVTCSNVTTGQTVVIKNLKGAAAWDCTTAGLIVSKGDVLKETLNGTAK